MLKLKWYNTFKNIMHDIWGIARENMKMSKVCGEYTFFFNTKTTAAGLLCRFQVSIIALSLSKAKPTWPNLISLNFQSLSSAESAVILRRKTFNITSYAMGMLESKIY